MSTRVVAVREDRLGARLCAIVNGLRIAEALRAPFHFLWPPDDEWGEEINDVDQVFAPAFIAMHRLPDQHLAEIRGLLDGRPPPPGEVYRCQAGGDELYVVQTPFGEYPLHRLPVAGAAADLPTVFRDRLAFTDTIRRHADAQLATLAAAGQAVGLHIRRGDVLRARADYEGRYAPLAFFDAYVRSQPRDRPAAFLIFSDDRKAGEDLVRRLPGLPVTLIGGGLSRLSVLERAVCEFLVMTRMQALVGTHSAFRETAALFGGGKAVDIRDALPAATRLEILRSTFAALPRDDAEYPITALCLAVESEAAGALAEALAAVDELIAWDPQYWYYPYLRARLEAKRGQEVAALAAIGHALALDPTAARARALHGALLARAGRLEEAEAELRTAIAAHPGRTSAYRELAAVLRQRGRHREAEAVIAEALALKPDTPKLHLELARLRLRRGAVGGAIAALRRAAARPSR